MLKGERPVSLGKTTPPRGPVAGVAGWAAGSAAWTAGCSASAFWAGRPAGFFFAAIALLISMLAMITTTARATAITVFLSIGFCSLFLLRYGVVSPGVERVAAAQALDRQPQAAEKAVLQQRLPGVLGAGRGVPAGRRVPGGPAAPGKGDEGKPAAL